MEKRQGSEAKRRAHTPQLEQPHDEQSPAQAAQLEHEHGDMIISFEVFFLGGNGLRLRFGLDEFGRWLNNVDVYRVRLLSMDLANADISSGWKKIKRKEKTAVGRRPLYNRFSPQFTPHRGTEDAILGPQTLPSPPARADGPVRARQRPGGGRVATPSNQPRPALIFYLVD